MEVAMQLGLLAKGGQHYVDGPLWIPAAAFIGLCVLPLLIRAIRRRSLRAQAEETPGWYPDNEGRP